MARKFYPQGYIYNHLLEPFLVEMKVWIADYISRHKLYPSLDICCGTGRQSLRTANAGDTMETGSMTVGLDLDFHMLKYASGNISEIPFVCADAARIPVSPGSFKSAVVSFALHDKSREMQMQMISEIRSLLDGDGHLICLDFEKPWSTRSKLGFFLTTLIERMAGRDHFRNGREFLRAGGLSDFLKTHGLRKVERKNFDLACSSIIISVFKDP